MYFAIDHQCQPERRRPGGSESSRGSQDIYYLYGSTVHGGKMTAPLCFDMVLGPVDSKGGRARYLVHCHLANSQR